MIKFIQYRNKCIGCGICYELQPLFWRMSKKDGRATLLHAVNKNEIYQATVASSKELGHFVATSCPVNAIKVV